MDLEALVERLYELNVGLVGTGAQQHERPHKPVLLLTVLDLADRGVDPGRVAWNDDLRRAFKATFDLVQRRDDKATPQYPFFHLRSDGFWRPVEQVDGQVRELGREPRVADRVWAEVDPDVAAILRDPDQRAVVRRALVARYFPHAAPVLCNSPTVADAATAEDRPGRTAGFRKAVLRIYDHKCAACGIQVRLPDPPLSLVEAAHLRPFAVSHDDHPSNGLALCKNHHWAMDHHLLAPTPELTWAVSPRIIPHRSTGEAELYSRRGLPVLPPHDPAYAPSAAGLQYRAERLLR